jgi:hypothetical protein
MLVLEGDHVFNPAYNKRFGYTFIPMDEMKELSNFSQKSILINSVTEYYYTDAVLKEWQRGNISLEQLIAVIIIHITSHNHGNYNHFAYELNLYSNLSLAIDQIICKTQRTRRNIIFRRLVMLGLDITSYFFAHIMMDYIARVQSHISVEQLIFVREEMLYLSFDMGASPYISNFVEIFDCARYIRNIHRCTPETLCSRCIAPGVMKKLYNKYLKRISLYEILKKELYNDL